MKFYSYYNLLPCSYICNSKFISLQNIGFFLYYLINVKFYFFRQYVLIKEFTFFVCNATDTTDQRKITFCYVCIFGQHVILHLLLNIAAFTISYWRIKLDFAFRNEKNSWRILNCPLLLKFKKKSFWTSNMPLWIQL